MIEKAFLEMYMRHLLFFSFSSSQCRNIVFFAASPWVVLVALTIWDEDFLAVEHIVTAIAILSMILAICRSAIPDEVWSRYL